LEASPATRSKISLTKEFRIDMALFEIPVSGCTCFKTVAVSILFRTQELSKVTNNEGNGE